MKCQEVVTTLGTLLVTCRAEAPVLVWIRHRAEGPYWLCEAHADHYVRNRNCLAAPPPVTSWGWHELMMDLHPEDFRREATR